MAGNSNPAKKFRSKWTRIAVEGATTDGRTIERSWLEDIAAQYNPATYGARINCEHIKGIAPESPFGAYGDVLAVKAEEVEIDGKQKLALYAQLQPNDALLALNKKGQKIYTSIEVQPKFADTGKAYLIGLAITDSPASLGTEALEFSAKHGTLANRKQHPDNLFTAAEEAELEFEEVTEKPGAFGDLANRVKALFTKGKETDSQFAEVGEAVTALVEFAEKQQASLEKHSADATALGEKVTQLEATVAELTEKLGNTADHSQQQRPPVAGGDGQIKTQF
ncbi:GPO family capsid scaffolding protein [Stutzerimonas stutzeri]|uniref:GPO family capsid scaffolding protein n=1 Tax=Stutzerimonas stutzeri TaxID=316 RepID=UPI00265953A3|nr:GPO family capsid scaffolding protein [Stutzerimonas stutzeri]MCF6782571.1 GPO family capsid scaffolding protein [Stutzerimonas stutzeri]MCF6805676.1 GPO family capsid scaffolding protein [Stutzerimonas stutzeri]